MLHTFVAPATLRVKSKVALKLDLDLGYSSLVKTAKKKNSFSVSRRRRRTEVVDDYTELIDELLRVYGVARIGVIAAQLGVSHVTALRTARRLEDQGYLLVAEKGKGLQLTAKGRNSAKRARERHEILEEFLLELGVCPATAANDAEGAEHYLSDETFVAIKKFLGR